MITQQERLSRLERQLERLGKRIAQLDQRSNSLGWLRVSIFFVGIVFSLSGAFLLNWWIGGACFLLAMLLFSIAAYYQQRADRSLTRHQIWRNIKEAEAARIRLDWNAIPDAYTPEQRIEHPFEIDLDITGKHSLHRLMNTGVTTEGAQRLREWLLVTRPDLTTIQARQDLLRELIPMSAFRTRLTMKAMLAVRGSTTPMEGKRLLDWLQKQKLPARLKSTIVISHTLSLLLLTLLILNLFGILPQYWILVFVVETIFLMLNKDKRGNLFDNAYYLRDAFSQLNAVFSYLETYRYGRNRCLRQLCSPYFVNIDARPSRLLGQVQRVASGATLERNMLIWLLVNLLLPRDFYLVLRFHRALRQVAESLPIWLNIWFELEALNSLATFAYLHPEYTLPTVRAEVDEAHPLPVRACNMGHPLLLVEQKVVNDFSLEQIGEIVLITGSNMAGKSTFLRTLGMNLCLAFAGAPVNATGFETILLRIFTCIKISDSVTDGYSYFYAEVRRLRKLLDELAKAGETQPLFFLIDEIFRGTNNRERRIGSEAYIKALSGKHCLGLLSTHDLELVKLADLLPRIHNCHFREEVVDGQMVFDYILRDGPCPTTNALKIMQMEGLPIPGAASQDELSLTAEHQG